MPQKFKQKLLSNWRKLALPLAGETFVAAVSGGADSCALLCALNELRLAKKLELNFVVAHFNHNLRGAESDSDENFVRDLAAKLQLKFISEKAEIRHLKFEIRDNLEQWARNSRYEFLQRTASKLNAYGVLTAHTLDDQAETFLLNLIRGSGSEGLGAMKNIREFQDSTISRFQDSTISRFQDFKIPESQKTDAETEKAKIQNLKSKIFLIRPLLNLVRRSETENYCCEQHIEFRRDAMNEDLKFSRVRVRKELLPLLRSFNPKITEKLAETAFLLQSENDELNEIAFEKLKSRKAEHQSSIFLELKFLKSLSVAMRKRILRVWLKEMRGDLRRLDAKHLQAIENLVFSEKSGKIIELPEGEKILKENGFLHFLSPNV